MATDIAQTNDCLEYLGLSQPDGDDYTLVARLKDRVENQIRKFVRHGVTQATYTHLLPSSPIIGNESIDTYVEITGGRVSLGRGRYGADVLQLPQMFVRSITSVYEDVNAKAGQGSNDFPAATLLTAGTEYWLDVDETGLSRSGFLIREAGTWSRRPRTIKVTYVAGLTAAELESDYSDIKDLICEEVQMRFQRAKSMQGTAGAGGRIKSESIGGEYSVSYDTGVMTTGSGLMAETEAKLDPYVFWGTIL